MRRLALAAIAGLTLAILFGAPFDARAQGPDTRIDLTQGNIDLSVVDGTAVSMAPGTALDIRTGGAPGAGTDIEVEHGQIYVSNVLSDGPGVLRVHTGGQVWELERGAALFSFTSDGPSATMLHGRSLGVPGGGIRIRQPGQRLQVGPDGAVREARADPGEVRAMIRNTGAPGAPPNGPGGPGHSPGGRPGLAGQEGAPPPGMGAGLGPGGEAGTLRPTGQGLQQRNDALQRATEALNSGSPASPGSDPNGLPDPGGSPGIPVPDPGGSPGIPVPDPGGSPGIPVPDPGGSPGIPVPDFPPFPPGGSPNGPPGPVGNPNGPPGPVGNPNFQDRQNRQP